MSKASAVRTVDEARAMVMMFEMSNRIKADNFIIHAAKLAAGPLKQTKQGLGGVATRPFVQPTAMRRRLGHRTHAISGLQAVGKSPSYLPP